MTDSQTPVTLLHGDVLDRLAELADASVDAVVTDPPYGLSRQPDMVEVLTAWLAGDDYVHRGGGFMGETWDSFVPGPSVWREVFRVLKPGGHALVFAGSRTQDLMGMSLRLAGFEIRDVLAWMYGSGVPKGQHLGRYASEWDGWYSQIKPAYEPVLLAQKTFDGTIASNVQEHGVGALNVAATRLAFRSDADRDEATVKNQHGKFGSGPRTNEVLGKVGSVRSDYDPSGGRFPANVLLDEGAAAALDVQSGVAGEVGGVSRFFYCAKASKKERNAGLPPREDGKNANIHKTVKPVAVMDWLVALITPPGGTVLDPYVGSGTTGMAAAAAGHPFVGIDHDAEYLQIAGQRIRHHADTCRSSPEQLTIG